MPLAEVKFVQKSFAEMRLRTRKKKMMQNSKFVNDYQNFSEFEEWKMKNELN